MNRAVQYAGLVGKYVLVSRPATEEERVVYSEETVGLGGYVSMVQDTDNGVEIVTQDGLGIEVDNNPQWRFEIYVEEPTHRVR